VLGAPRSPESSGDQDRKTDDLRRIFQILRKTTGVDFTNYKFHHFGAGSMAHIYAVPGSAGYVGYLQQHPQEVGSSEEVLIHVTGFFREPEAFDLLREQAFPSILQARQTTIDSDPVPGCSSGKRSSVAIARVLGDSASTIGLRIFGTDVSQRMIDKARAGTYARPL
jgi:two-component system CheB/CheR fusion protein